ncbi:hypothetical protein [Mucilaginibacter sp.]|uniref:hypothetical protein n=1 Tax=Mucilaginibacter sp. TaxID=1882438 RepID=UPI002628FD1D|nr:hypothetical protein [Mucilaginibacter sp.]MDB4925545.1 hypothetical protein [Mucilaginibacter sp.]
MKNSFKALLVVMTILFSCGTTTMVTNSWRKPNATANGYKKIFVAAITSNIPAKQAVENGLQRQLEQKGIMIVKSTDVFPPNFSTQTGQRKELILGRIQSTGADGILTIALLKQTTETHYIPRSGFWNPGLRYGYYNNFWNYYNNWYPSIYAPDYYDEQEVYYLETNLYNARNEQLIWAAQSKTYDPVNIDSFLKGYLKSIYDQMVKDGLITSSPIRD